MKGDGKKDFSMHSDGKGFKGDLKGKPAEKGLDGKGKGQMPGVHADSAQKPPVDPPAPATWTCSLKMLRVLGSATRHVPERLPESHRV